MFFLYECQNVYFKEKEKFENCKSLREIIKEETMFKKYYSFGWKNNILKNLRKFEIDEDFEVALK